MKCENLKLAILDQAPVMRRAPCRHLLDRDSAPGFAVVLTDAILPHRIDVAKSMRQFCRLESARPIWEEDRDEKL